MADKINVGHVMLLCQFGNMPMETVLYNTARFARDVMPKLRDRFTEHEDRWWPKTTVEVQKPASDSIAAE
jgi:hypothetical protein